MPHELADITECLLCGEKFTGPRIAIVGRPNARMEQLLSTLGAHFESQHPQHAQAMNIDGASFMGMLFLMNFKSTDQQLIAQRDHLRWQVHQKTLAVRVPDDKLEKVCGDLSVEISKVFIKLNNDTLQSMDFAEKAATVMGLLIPIFEGLRDELEEPNKYPSPSVVVTN